MSLNHINTAHDFTNGNIAKHILSFSIPLFIGSVLQVAYHTVDTFFVGMYLGSNSIAAVSSSFPIIIAMISFVIGMSSSTTTLVAQSYGAKRYSDINKVISNSLSINIVLGLLFGVLGYFFRFNLLGYVNTPNDILLESSAYVSIMSFGFLPTCLYNVCASIMRGLGDSKTPLRILAITSVVNVALDPLFIFGHGFFPKLGVEGAAIASLISQSLCAIYCIWYLVNKLDYCKRLKDWFYFDARLTLLTLKIGFPLGLQQALLGLGSMKLLGRVNAFGSIHTAGYGIGARIEQFASLPMISISNAISSILAQNIGAREDERVKKTIKISMIFAVAVSILIMTVIAFFAKDVASIFTNDPKIAESCALYLRLISLSYVPLSIMHAFTGIFRGTGDTLAVLLMTCINIWLFRGPVSRYLSYTLNMGFNGVPLGMVVSHSLGMILSLMYFCTGLWKRLRLVSKLESAFDQTQNKNKGQFGEIEGPAC